jgi:poly-gamma-glutamate capsule biosynthesis protein CapA/YwtB (metallophosphatase superfamily)
MSRKWLWVYGGMIFCIISISLYLFYFDRPFTKTTTNYVQQMPESDVNYPQNQPKSVTTSATILAVGDVLIHSTVYNAAKTPNGYDFKPMFKLVKPLISEADIAVANSESMIGGAKMGLSTYPAFNSPYEVGDALKDAGFDVVTMANNHTLDRGETAIANAIHYWDKIGMVHTGSFLNTQANDKIVTVEKNGIVFSFLAYTYGTNGIPTPTGKDYLVNRIDLPLMKQDIERAKAVSDVVVVSLHFGTEYQRYPNEGQKKLVKELAGLGVDIILGSHPHVLQPFGLIEGMGGHQTFVIYSLGNFISGQIETYRQIGGMLQLKVEKTTDRAGSKVVVENPTFVPTWVQPRTFDIIPLKSAGNYGLAQAPLMYQEMMVHMVEK